jgi:molybdopterin-guanine dinucleotide biosynthesis protein MobB
VIKHAHHTFEIDHPGKDSYELRKAGAAQTLVASRHRWALVVEEEHDGDPSLDQLIPKLDISVIDLILVEGFKHSSIPKIEIYRQNIRRPLQCLKDSSIIAVAADRDPPDGVTITWLDLNEPEQVVSFILNEFVTGGTVKQAAKVTA